MFPSHLFWICIQEKHALKRSECIFKYWASVAPTNPDLHKLAMNVIALPVTQVSVERTFSCLKYILSPLSSMNAQVLEDILFVRLNKQYGLKAQTD